MRKIFELAGTITVNGLEALQKGLKSVEGDLERADRALTKFGRQTVKAGTTLTKYVTAPIVGMGAAIVLAADRVGEYALSLEKMTQQSGMSTDTLQEFSYIAKKVGIDVSDINGAILKFSKQLSGTEIGSEKVAVALKTLGISAYNTDGSLRNMNDLFPEMLKRLNELPNVNQRNAIAMQIFGKGAGAIAPLLKLSSNEIETMRKKAHELGIVMGGDALNSALEYRKGMVDLKEQAAALWRDLAIRFIPVLKDVLFPVIQNNIIPAFKKFVSIIGNVFAWFNNMDSGTKKIILGFAALVAVMGPALIVFGKSILIVKSLIAAFVLLKTAFIGITIAMATNPFTALIAAAGVAVAALFGVKMWMDNVKKSAADREKLNMFGEEIEGLFSRMEARAGRGRMTLDMILDLQKNSMVSEKALVQHLSAMAEDYGFIISGTDAQRIKQLKRINDLIKETGNITLAAKKYNDELARETKNTEDANNAAVEKTDLFNKLQDEYAALTEGEIEGLERAREAEKIKAAEKIKDKKELNEALLLIDAIYDEKIDQAQIKDADDRAALDKDIATKQIEKEKSTKIKLLEMQGDTVGVLKQQYEDDLKNFGDTEEKKAIIKAYYDKEIAKAEAKTQKSTLDKVGEWVNLASQAVSQITSIFTMSTQNKIAANDNWYEKEKEAIEKSGISNKAKEKKMEALDEKYNAKRKQLQHEAAVRERAGAIFGAIVGTAQAVISALSTKPFIPLGLIAAGMATVLGAVQTAVIASQPLPFAAGGLVKKRAGGVNAVLGEGREDEIVFPLESGVKSLANKLIERLAAITLPPVPALAFAGGGGAGMRAGDTHFHVGTLIADDYGLKELERRQSKFRISEAQRMGR